MDFLEDLFGDCNRQKRSGFFQNENHHDDDPHGDHDHHHQYPANPSLQVPANPATFQPGLTCRNCSTQTVHGAKFCHTCGAAIGLILNCASCGSKLPAAALFCPKCGYKKG